LLVFNTSWRIGELRLDDSNLYLISDSNIAVRPMSHGERLRLDPGSVENQGVLTGGCTDPSQRSDEGLEVATSCESLFAVYEYVEGYHARAKANVPAQGRPVGVVFDCEPRRNPGVACSRSLALVSIVRPFEAQPASGKYDCREPDAHDQRRKRNEPHARIGANCHDNRHWETHGENAHRYYPGRQPKSRPRPGLFFR